MTAWECAKCGWSGYGPSITDASELRPDCEGNLRMDRLHIAICPRCFEQVQTARAKAAAELRRVLVGIARCAA